MTLMAIDLPINEAASLNPRPRAVKDRTDIIVKSSVDRHPRRGAFPGSAIQNADRAPPQWRRSHAVPEHETNLAAARDAPEDPESRRTFALAIRERQGMPA